MFRIDRDLKRCALVDFNPVQVESTHEQDRIIGPAQTTGVHDERLMDTLIAIQIIPLTLNDRTEAMVPLPSAANGLAETIG